MSELPLVCAMPNKRPRVATEAMRRDAAESVVADISGDIGNKSEAVDDILAVTRRNQHMDGYQIARELERCKHWDCDMEIAEALDGFASACSMAVYEAQKKWAAENPIEPPFPVGTTVKTPHGVGAIDRVYEHGPHQYVVPLKGMMLVINFEDVSVVDDKDGGS